MVDEHLGVFRETMFRTSKSNCLNRFLLHAIDQTLYSDLVQNTARMTASHAVVLTAGFANRSASAEDCAHNSGSIIERHTQPLRNP